MMHDPTYELEIKQTLTIKPNKFYIHAIPRAGAPNLVATPSSTLLETHKGSTARAHANGAPGEAPKQPLYVLYGSNTGSSEAFAQRLATDAPSHGKWLDQTVSHIVHLRV